MDIIRQDLKLALRRLRAQPTSTLTILFVLGLGIGATLVVAAIVDAVLLRPLDLPDPDRLVVVEERSPEGNLGNAGYGNTSYPTFEDIRRDGSSSLDAVAGYRFSSAYVTQAAEPQQILVAKVTADFFRVFGVAPQVGRAFAADESERQSKPVVVINHSFWMRQFSGRPGAVGETVNLDGVPHEIIGVMPARFFFPGWATMWAPFGAPGETTRAEHDIAMVARLAPDAPLRRAQAELATLGSRIADAHPDTFAEHSLGLRPLLDLYVASSRPVLLAVLGAVFGLLLIVCLNIATLQTAVALDRQREIAVRAALGAGRGRVLRQLMTENLMLAMLGGLGGLLIAVWGLEAAITLGPQSLVRLDEARIDVRVAGFAVAVTGLTALVFGLFPSLLASRLAPQAGLRGGRGATAGGKTVSARTVLVAAQVALTLAMLLTAGLTLRSFQSLLDSDLGFDFDRIATVGFVLPPNQFPETHQRMQWIEQIFRAVSQVPGVEAVSTINFVPLDRYQEMRTIRAPGFTESAPKEGEGAHTVAELVVNHGYFKTAGIPLVIGRAFQETDLDNSESVVIVSQALSQRIWGTTSPLGRQLLVAAPGDEAEAATATVVGIAADVRQVGVAAPKVDQIYRPYAQTGWRYSNLIVRSQPGTAPASLLTPIQRAVGSVDPDRPLFDAKAASSVRAYELAEPRLRSFVLTFFSAFGLLLAAVGIYSVLAVMVRSRRREIGIRLALGSSRRGVRRLVIRQGMVLTLLGLALGVPIAWLAVRLLAAQLHGVGTFDALTIVSALTLLATTAAVAILGPARRASRVDPIVALRDE